jgi:TonB-linked SusC/RagA family outer membrane protein
MNQKHDFKSLKSKRKNNSFGIGILAMFICLGMQLATANAKTTFSNIELENNLQSTITGTISDAMGPLPGATVIVKGTTTGTQSDFDGNFSIDADSDAVLVISYIGYKTIEVPVNGQSSINVTLEEDASQLDEVVVTGYGTQTRGSITGAVSSVDMDEAAKQPVTNAAEALQGRVSGVSVIRSNSPGAPPKIVIRGFGTSNNTDPLYIIDGVQTDDANVLNSINPNDIEQMNVLKDGAAAIYGARASNGVVIITTKSGGYNMESAKISIDAYSGLANVYNIPTFMNAQQHGQMLFQSFQNDGVAFDHAQYGPNGEVPSEVQNYSRIASYNPIVRENVRATVQPGGTDWLDEITRTAVVQNVSFSVSNGNESGKYVMSANYLNRQGIQLFTYFKQGNTRLNSEFKLGDKVTIGQHFSASYSIGNDQNQIGFAKRANPLIPVRDDEGNFAGTAAAQTSNGNNPVALLTRAKDNYNKNFRTFGDVYLNWQIVDGLSAKTTISALTTYFNQRNFSALNPEVSEPVATNTLSEQDSNSTSWTWTNTLNFNKTYGKHNINAIVGVEALREMFKGKQIIRTGYLFEDPDFYLLSNGSGAPLVNFASQSSNSLSSLFGTASYTYDNKYFLTATLRRDTSSRFRGDNKSDTFPSFSAGWLVSDENFFPKDGIVSRVKLKGSWGEIGNQTLPAANPTLNISQLNENFANYALGGNSLSTGAILSQVGNPNLRWETSEAINYGIELGFFDNALTMNLDIFDIQTKDLVSPDNSLISSTAIDAGAPLVNLGNVSNKGFDFSLGYASDASKDFHWGVQANLSRYKNEVTDLISAFQVGRSFRVGSITRTEVGQPISYFFGRKVTGLDDNGRFTYDDLNNDGTINDEDRQFIGSPHPDFTYGLNLNLAYKNIDVSAFFSGSEGNDGYNYDRIYSDFPFFINGNRDVRLLDAWTPTNTDTNIPALTTAVVNAESGPNSYFVEDASYLKLKNLQIGYTLGSKLSDKIGVDSFRIYLQGTDLFTWTKYTGVDPEIRIFNNDQNRSDNLTLGVDEDTFPLSRIISLGVNLKL